MDRKAVALTKLRLFELGEQGDHGLSSSHLQCWKKLWLSSYEPYPSTHPVWAIAHARHLTSPSGTPRALFLEDGRETTLAAAVVIEGSRAMFANGSDVTDFNDFCYDYQTPNDTLSALLECLFARGVNELVLSSLTSDSVTIKTLEEVAPALGWSFACRVEDEALSIPLPKEWQGYLDFLDKKSRHELLRKIRKANREHSVSQSLLTTSPDIGGSIGQFCDFLQDSKGPKGRFFNPLRRKFITALANDLAEEGYARLTVLSLDHKNVAISLSFEVNQRSYLYNSAYTVDSGDVSAGIVNHALDIGAAIERGVTWYDLMRGNEDYKSRLGGVALRKICEVRLSKR